MTHDPVGDFGSELASACVDSRGHWAQYASTLPAPFLPLREAARPNVRLAIHPALKGSFEREGTRRVESQRECSEWRSSMKRTTVVTWIGLAVALVLAGTLLAQ